MAVSACALWVSESLTAATVWLGCCARYITSRGKCMNPSQHCFALFGALHLPRSVLTLATGITTSQEHWGTRAVWLCWGIQYILDSFGYT